MVTATISVVMSPNIKGNVSKLFNLSGDATCINVSMNACEISDENRSSNFIDFSPFGNSIEHF